MQQLPETRPVRRALDQITHGSLPPPVSVDQLFEHSEHLSEVEIIALTYDVASYKLHALMCRALRLEFDDVDEPIVEIAAPADGDTDVMGTISMRD
ncbi:MAG: hypothetical protein ACI88C_003394 [Acidimicrobiales bacterium]